MNKFLPTNNRLPVDFPFPDAIKIYLLRVGFVLFIALTSLLFFGVILLLIEGESLVIVAISLSILFLLFTLQKISTHLPPDYRSGELELLLTPILNFNSSISVIARIILLMFIFGPFIATVSRDVEHFILVLGSMIGLGFSLEIARKAHNVLGGVWEPKHSLWFWQLSFVMILATAIIHLTEALDIIYTEALIVAAFLTGMSAVSAPVEFLIVARWYPDSEVQTKQISELLSRLVIVAILIFLFAFLLKSVSRLFEFPLHPVRFPIVVPALFSWVWLRLLIKKTILELGQLIRWLFNNLRIRIDQIENHFYDITNNPRLVDWLRLVLRIGRDVVIVMAISSLLFILLPISISLITTQHKQ